MKSYVSYRDELKKDLADSTRAGHYLRAALDAFHKDHNLEALMLAFRSVVDAQGGVTRLAKKTRLARQTLYKALSTGGNPGLMTIGAVLSAMGLKLSIDHA